MSRTKIFVSYSHEDERWRKRVVGQLGVLVSEGLIDLWDDRKIGAGEDWFAQIHEQMLDARIAVLLISSAFLTSEFIRKKEVPTLFERHEQDGMTLYPLLMKPCAWQEVAWLAKMQLRPTGTKPVASYKGIRVDEVLAEVAQEIASIARVQAQSKGRLTTARADKISERIPLVAGTEPQEHTDSERVLKLRVHRAWFVGNPVESYFINVTNLSPSRALEVTHVWYEDEKHHIPVNQPSRSLPVRLELDQSWETWIEVAKLPAANRSTAHQNFRARISTGAVFKSEATLNIPPYGSVPGGPIPKI